MTGRGGSRKDADPMRESSMKFFKEAFENISLHHGSDSVNSLFLKEKKRAEHAKSNVRLSFQTDNQLFEDPVTVSGAPTSFLKNRRMSAKRNNIPGGNSETISHNSFQRTGNKFFQKDANPATTSYKNDPLTGDIQSIIDGFSQEQSSFKNGIRIKVRQSVKRMG